MSYNLFLDDVRYPHQVTWVDLPLVEWKIVRSYDEFVRYIQQHGLPNRISFDHDLSLEHYPLSEADGGSRSPHTIPYNSYKEKTGYHCAKWLAEYCISNNLPYPETFVHSMNPIGSENIWSIVTTFNKVFTNVNKSQ